MKKWYRTSAEGASYIGGSGGMPPREILKARGGGVGVGADAPIAPPSLRACLSVCFCFFILFFSFCGYMYSHHLWFSQSANCFFLLFFYCTLEYEISGYWQVNNFLITRIGWGVMHSRPQSHAVFFNVMTSRAEKRSWHAARIAGSSARGFKMPLIHGETESLVA